uniref:hypothetical protein n=1 Tax=Sphingomonas sp. GlSt437 TaxID=3389970 RepID=UPI003A87F1ED
MALKPAIAAFSVGALVSETAVNILATYYLYKIQLHIWSDKKGDIIAIVGAVFIALVLMARVKEFRVGSISAVLSKIDNDKAE